MLSGTYRLIYQDTKLHLRGWAILSTHITPYTFVSFVNSEYVWVPLNGKERNKKKKKKSLKARQLSKSRRWGTRDRDSSSHPSFHSPIIKVTEEGRQPAPGLQLWSTSSSTADFLLPSLSAGQEHRIIPETGFARNYSHSSPGFPEQPNRNSWQRNVHLEAANGKHSMGPLEATSPAHSPSPARSPSAHC